VRLGGWLSVHMLSIFDNKEFEPPQDKKVSLDRLEQMLGAPQRPAAAEERPAAATAAVAEEPPPVRLAPPKPVSWERKSAPQTPPVRFETPNAGFQQFSEQFTRTFLEALASTVKDIHALVGEDRRRMESAFEFFTKTSRELDALRGDMGGVSQKFDLLVRGLQELSVRLGKAEEALSLAGSTSVTLQELQQQLEKRLELQAGVIRTLHNGMQSREERIDKLMAMFQSLQSVSTQAAAPMSLPEKL